MSDIESSDSESIDSFKDILPDKDPYHNRGRDQMRKKGGLEFEYTSPHQGILAPYFRLDILQ
jgi:hypothetical protein